MSAATQRERPREGPATAQASLPGTLVVVPTLNEERYILACLDSLLADAPDCLRRIVVVDGGSTDRTVALVQALARRDSRVGMLHNPKRLQSAAVNLAARVEAPELPVLVRADAHSLYPPGWVRDCVTALAETGAASVVVPLHTQGTDGLQRAIAAAQNSRLGNGGSAHRMGISGRYVEHGHHAAFDRAAFLRVGGYDESFSHNEDAEFDHRLGRAGGRIWMAPYPVGYFPRSSLWQLARQYRRHGAGRARTIRLHRMRPRLRQLAPVVVLPANLAGLALAPVLPAAAALPLAYATLCLAGGVATALRKRDRWLLAMGPACMVMHHAWAAGFLAGWVRGAGMKEESAFS